MEIFDLLVSYNADMWSKSHGETQMSPLHWASSMGHLEIVKYIVHTNKECMDVQDNAGCTPLIVATQYNFINVVIFLINSKCDLYTKDSNGDTALHWAAYKGYDIILEMLLFFMLDHLDSEDNFGQV
jgi:ankyrin repeat protein